MFYFRAESTLDDEDLYDQFAYEEFLDLDRLTFLFKI